MTERQQTLKGLTFFLQLARAYRWQVVLSIFAAVCTVLAGMGLMTSSGYLISRAAERPPILDLMLIIVAVRFFALSRAAFRYLERLVSHDLTFKWLMALRVQLYHILEPLMPGLLLRRRSGDLMTRMVADLDSLQNLYLRVIAPTLTAIIVIAITVAALHVFSPLLAWVTFFFLALNGVGLPWYAVAQARGLGRDQVFARSDLQSALVENLQGLGDLLTLGAKERARRIVQAGDRQLSDLQIKQASISGAQDGLHHLCGHLGMWTVLVLAIPMVASGELQGVHLAMLTLGVLTSFEAVQALGTAFQFHEQTQTAHDRIEALRHEPPPVRAPASAIQPATHDIRFEEVTFAYDSIDAVADVSFSLPFGRRLAIVGPSGAGKSTMAYLALRFRDPDAGVITLDGRPLTDYTQEEVIRHMAVIPQHTHLFNDTIRTNLQLARQDADDDSLWSALKRAQLAGFVRALPNGLDTLIGEQGATLSGGERQRMAIARAFLKDAPILVLDEPTSHLDAVTEQRVLDELFAYGSGRTMLWITHRLLQLERAHSILVMDRGRIVERGTHEKLVEADGLYARMLRLQNQVLET